MQTRSLAPCSTLVLLALLAGCEAAGSGEAGGGIVARAAGHTLTVDQVVSLLEGRDEIPNDRSVVRTVAGLWLDYTVLAETVREDPSLEDVDLDPLLRPQLEQDLILEFRDSVVSPDTVFTDEELRREYQRSGSDVQVRARHILLSFPEGASDARRDSVEERARELRRRALEGEDFAELARAHSDDSGTADQGGDLGFFGRDEMPPAFEEAAFSLDPGELSEPVETPYGLHLIRLEDRRIGDFEANRDQFARELRQRRSFEAESTYLATLEEPADVRIRSDAYRVIRELAARPDVRLTSRARDRALVHYEDGTLTAGEVRSFLQGRSPQERNQLATASEEQIDRILQNLTRRELLLNEAREAGFEISGERRDSLETRIRDRLRQIVSDLGLDTLAVGEGQGETGAVRRAVDELLARTVSGQQQVVPLGNLAYELRDRYDAEIFDVGVARTVERRAREQTADGQNPEPSASSR